MSTTASFSYFSRGWSWAKAGNRPKQNDDAYRLCTFVQSDCSIGCLAALSDGAAEAVYSGRWATALVTSAEPDWLRMSDREIAERLQEVRDAFVPLSDSESVPWYVRQKFENIGSQATLLVFSLAHGEDRAIGTAVGVGDSCIILCKANGEVLSFPLVSAAEFGAFPELIGSRPTDETPFHRWQFVMDRGDLLFACTDAVAKWILECRESERMPFVFESMATILSASRSSRMVLSNQVHFLPTPPAAPDGSPRKRGMDLQLEGEEPLTFERFIAASRSKASSLRMRNDDSTLAILSVVKSEGTGQVEEVIDLLRSHQTIMPQNQRSHATGARTRTSSRGGEVPESCPECGTQTLKDCLLGLGRNVTKRCCPACNWNDSVDQSIDSSSIGAFDVEQPIIELVEVKPPAAPTLLWLLVMGVVVALALAAVWFAVVVYWYCGGRFHYFVP